MRTIKKYSNRRLYDTGESQYITLDELAALIRAGEDVEIVDAKTGTDLTRPTLAQIVVESRGAARLLPRDLLVQLIRMGDDALAEFMTHYVTWALEVYIQVKKGVSKLPGAGASPVTKMFEPWMRAYQSAWREASGVDVPPPPAEPDEAEATESDASAGEGAEDDVASLRREIDELKEMLHNLK